jgi:hypothetical protein
MIEDQERDEGGHRPVTPGINELPKQFDCPGDRRPQQRGDCTERQQHPQEPRRPRRPWTDRQRVPPEMEEIEISRCWRMIAQKGRIIGDRRHYEDRDRKRHAQSPGTAGQEVSGSPARQAVANEQSRNEKHAGHEETVVEQHDQVESEPAHRIAIAEIGVIDDRVVQHHQQRDKGARPFQRNDAFHSHHSSTAAIGFRSINSQTRRR